jgi:hypothetical protein
MNSYTKLFSSFVLSIFLFATIVHGQIVLESNEYPITFGATIQLYSANDETGPGFTVIVGTTGGPQTWSYLTGQFPGGENTEYTVVDPAATPFASSFPTSDHAWSFFDPSDTTDGLIFFDLTNTELLDLGMGVNTPLGPFTAVKNPAQKVIIFPAGLNTSWNTNHTSRLGIPGLFEDETIVNAQFLINGWGTITVPLGTFDCLRSSYSWTETVNTYVFGNLISSETTNTLGYTWYTETYGLLAEIESFDGETNPNFTQAQSVTLRGGTTAIEDEKTISTSYNLYQNYPNPFNPTTTIRYGLSKSAKVVLKIYNALGQEITTLVNEDQTAGEKSVVWDGRNQYGKLVSSGVYIYKLEANNFVESRKMLFLK